jgi:hypothetical protein
MSNPIPLHSFNDDLLLGTSVTGLSLGNAIVIAMSEMLIKKGILTKADAQSMVMEIVELVRQATDNSKSSLIADTLCNDLEDFAAGLCKTND